jgi:ubiquinone/menaquinone biosynthesis C-methylase UbiE
MNTNLSKTWDAYNRTARPQLQDRENWIAKYCDMIDKCDDTILELGCGQGDTTQFLAMSAKKILATDISPVAIEHVAKRFGDKVKTRIVDLTEPLPFEDNSFSFVVADLCLHYFTDEPTAEIMHEIKRVLKPNGHLVARVNSVKDKTETNVCANDTVTKRYFDKSAAEKFFNIIGKAKITETEIICHYKKQAIEICVQKSS